MVLASVPLEEDRLPWHRAQGWNEDAALRNGLLFLGGASPLIVLGLLDLSFL